MTRTACLVCFISTVNGSSKKKKEKKPIMSSASGWHIAKLKPSIFHLSISMDSPMTVTTVLALATLDRMTKIEMILSVSHNPRLPKQVQ